MSRFRFALAVAALVLAPTVASAQVSRPHPSATPRGDTSSLNGLSKPSAAPSCGSTDAGFYADTNGCIYSCSGSKRSVIARPLGNSCVQATTGPTATVTVTPTPTATVTPTPTVTSTP